MTLRIAFDHQAFVMQSYGGVSRYYTRLTLALVRAKIDAQIFAPLHKNFYLSELTPNITNGKYFKKFPPKTASLVNFYNSSKLNKSILHFKPDILHETYYRGNKNRSANQPVVITVYDMIHELLPEFFPAHDLTARYKHEAVNRADHIICISNSAKNDLIQIYNIPENKVSVVHLASDISISSNLNILSIDYTKPFILFVGQRSGYKNFHNFITSIALSPRLKMNFNIVCFGGGSFTSEETKQLHSLGFDNNQVIQTAGDDRLLSELYSSARAFVFPSRYEGFGLPLLEAMSNGCPVICSNVSSLPEVAGDAASYFDPNNIEEMSKVIEDVVFSDFSISELKRLGFSRSNMYSWDLCAEKTVAIYNNLL